jgi:hypothetical protein
LSRRPVASAPGAEDVAAAVLGFEDIEPKFDPETGRE